MRDQLGHLAKPRRHNGRVTQMRRCRTRLRADPVAAMSRTATKWMTSTPDAFACALQLHAPRRTMGPILLSPDLSSSGSCFLQIFTKYRMTHLSTLIPISSMLRLESNQSAPGSTVTLCSTFVTEGSSRKELTRGVMERQQMPGTTIKLVILHAKLIAPRPVLSSTTRSAWW
jgi:hypothetical protein